MAETGSAIHANRRCQHLHSSMLPKRARRQHFRSATLDLIHAETALCRQSEEDLRVALAENRMRDLSAGRTLIGPHRADVVGTFAAKGCTCTRLLNRGAEGAAGVSDSCPMPVPLRKSFGAPPLVAA